MSQVRPPHLPLTALPPPLSCMLTCAVLLLRCAEFGYVSNTFSITRKHMHGDVVYCVAMLCNYRRPLVPLPLVGDEAGVEDPQPEGLSDNELDDDLEDGDVDEEEAEGEDEEVF